jgi:hypothetical protein
MQRGKNNILFVFNFEINQMIPLLDCIVYTQQNVNPAEALQTLIKKLKNK